MCATMPTERLLGLQVKDGKPMEKFIPLAGKAIAMDSAYVRTSLESPKDWNHNPSWKSRSSNLTWRWEGAVRKLLPPHHHKFWSEKPMEIFLH